ncbi:hypothetical protein R3P38DRAFT_3325581 [Favolaschia claudopus]|uniref:Uncharacterized protein n=1 Tax=Favolaschia claudopus TaxID=2862362 RepID=A0AAW0AEJ5_9AGAR
MTPTAMRFKYLSAKVISSANTYQESSPPSSPPRLVDWGLSENTELETSLDSQAIAEMAHKLLEYLDAEPVSDDEQDERSDIEDELNQVQEPIVAVDDGDENGHGRKRARTSNNVDSSRQWYPWPDRITCTLDVLMHLPRSVFSHRQLDLFIWLLKVNNVDDVPSVKAMQELNVMLQTICGIESIPYNGALRHKYYVNSLAQIIAQEMSNPKVRPHLQFYPEDSGKVLEEARQGKRWLEELPSEKTTPMVRIGKQDYYIHEPAMLRDGTFCMPFRWFMRGNILFAKCWAMTAVTSDAGGYWRVLKQETEVSQFLGSGSHNNPSIGNAWRERAKGSRVVAFPIWMYCDDTSGNLFLFTPAGLSREQAAKEFNIHFLCTSNIAPPLEMLDGILDQLEESEEKGIWAWDSQENELILVIPAVLALLGDNPMQRSDALDEEEPTASRPQHQDPTESDGESSQPHTPMQQEPGSPGSPQVNSPVGSDAGSETSKAKKSRKRVKETLEQMMSRAKSFVKIGKLRTKEETTTTLRSYFEKACTVNTKTKVKEMRTASGIKDTFQLVFLEKLFESYKGKRGPKAKQEALDAKVRSLPPNTTSPVWRIKGLDPHQDTPVEILHVILLGFVKYMWRDLVQNQLKNKEEQKKLLETRLNSFDVQGLRISPLAGHTLVQYSGSLTGRDFRAIAQAAPFVVYDLVSPECLATWVALSKLIPLIWQPQIKDIDAHIALLTAEIDHFLACAARWTTRWFNKPKFHILLHLPSHIRRFGPAILFATEAFESFNAVIRAKSVHSNRHAPSRDIARAFAQGNRIRHLLSGGLFMESEILTDPTAHSTQAVADNNSVTASGAPPLLNPKKQATVRRPISHNRLDWKTAGRGPLSLVASPTTITQYLGLDKSKNKTRGLCVADKTAPRLFSATLAGKKLPNSLSSSNSAPPPMIQTNRAVYLENGDYCAVDQFVIVRRPDLPASTFVARVAEILQIKGSPEAQRQRPSAILLQSIAVNSTANNCYGMPHLSSEDKWSLAQLSDILCTVNVQHNCDKNKCGATGFRYVYQEREKSSQTHPVVVHTAGTKDDLLLNTGQMRDAVNLQPFRIDSDILDTEALIMSSVLREFEVARAAAASTHADKPLSDASADGTSRASETGRGRARGRGGGKARGRGAARGGMAGGKPADLRIIELQTASSSVS